MPQHYRIRYAQSADEVLRELGKLMDYVNSGPVISLLPSTLQNISSRNATDVAKWHEQIERDLDCAADECVGALLARCARRGIQRRPTTARRAAGRERCCAR